jgi:hypothetical protein
VKSVAASTPWTGTWSVSPESGGQSFGQQTLRQIVHTSIGGTSAQVQVSNVFGSAPLAVADVHVALRSSGSTIVSGSHIGPADRGAATADLDGSPERD